MEPDRFRQVRHLFEAVLEQSGSGQQVFLANASQGDSELRAEVERLLAAHQASTGVLDRPFGPPVMVERWEGRQIGAYQILRELGRGGMGSVYLASRADQTFQRLVAIKIVRTDIETTEILSRFHREREILASLDHPHIARLLDAGSTEDGLPYFVLEYVDGLPIDTYCDEHRLTVDQRLKLMGDVCDAVEYAHGQKVVHRDLKPGNILVNGEGVVKLLDFGIARLLGASKTTLAAPETRPELRLMTPEYASPEQVRGEAAGFASDVYSLGVVLYELLTGRRPYRLKSRIMHEVVRVICEEDPTRPSTVVTAPSPATESKSTTDEICRARHATPAELRRMLSGDLDSILLKALEKNPDHRYARPGEFREDLRRHAEGQTVSARSGAYWYQAWRGLQRNREWALASMALLLASISGMIKVDSVALWVAVVMLGSFVLGMLVVRREMGPWFTTQMLIRRTLALFVVNMFLMTIATRLPHGWSANFFSVLLVIALCPLIYQIIRWIFRDRWAGPLLAELSRPRSRAFVALPVVMVIASVMQSVGMGMSGKFDWHQSLLAFSQFILAANFFLLRHRLEFREKGIMSGGVVRWQRIQGYSWEVEDREYAYLQLRVRSLGLFTTQGRAMIPLEKKAAAERILEQKLVEWPS